MRAVAALRPILAAFALLAALDAGAQPLPGLDPDTRVEIDADTLVWEADVVRAEGAVRMRAGTLHLDAARVAWDTGTGVATLEGGVTLVDGPFVARAERGAFDIATGAGHLEEVALWQKREAIDPDALLAAPPAALGAEGENAVAIRAASIRRDEAGTWNAIRPTVTTCDCGEEPPSWSVGAARAKVTPDDRLHLYWPVFHVRGVPVLAFPWFSLPIDPDAEDRQTGLLAPDVGIFSRRGFSWEQPLYLVLGESWDATVAAGWFFGSTDERVVPPSVGGPAVGTEREVHRSFRGPRLSGELRYVPREGTAGRFFGAWARDLSYRLPVRGSLVPGTVPQDPALRYPVAKPDRFFLQWDHVDDLPAGFSDRIALNLASDRFWLRDFTDEVVRRDAGVLTSSAWFAWRGGPVLLAAEGTYLQDLRLPFEREADVPEGFLESPELFGAGRRNTFARVPAFAADVAYLRLPGGLSLSAHLGVARFAPLTSTGFGDEGEDGLGPGDRGYTEVGPDAGENDGRLGPGERPATTRLALRPTLSLPLVFGRWLSLTPSAGWRQLLYANDAGADGHAGWGVLGLDAHTELARTFGGGRIRHAIVPRLQVRGLLPADAAAAPTRPYDELEVRPLESFGQARVALGSRLHLARRGGGVVALEAEVGQDFDLAPIAAPEASFLRADVDLLPLRLDGLLRWDAQARALAEVAADASLTARQGHQLRLGYRRLAPGGSSRLLAGPDELFAPGRQAGERLALDLVDPGTVERLHQVGAGVTIAPVAPLRLRYDLLWLPTLGDTPILEQRAGAIWVSPCDCWAAELRLALRRNERLPDVGISLDLGGLLRI